MEKDISIIIALLTAATFCTPAFGAVNSHKPGEKHEAVNGTCTTPGTIEWYSCEDENCKEKLDSNGNTLESITGTIVPYNHSWDNGAITKEATEDEDGIMCYTCTECGETRQEYFSAPIEPGKKKACDKIVFGVCEYYNRIINIPVLSTIVGVIHLLVHYFQ